MKGIQAFCTLQLFCKATTDKIKSLSKRLLQKNLWGDPKPIPYTAYMA